jgi:transposase
MRKLKQVLGIDVAQKELVVTLGRIFEDLSVDLYAYKVFANNEKGFIALLKWVKLLTDGNVKIQFVMEATGVYHQKFAYFLEQKNYNISIVLPNKISNYMRTLDIKTVTDKTCSEAISRFGLERKLDNWKRPKQVFKSLQQLTRERDQIVHERTMVKNQYHAESVEAMPNKNSIDRFKLRIIFLNSLEKNIKDDIAKTIKEDAILKAEIANISTIPGVGELTAVIVLAETNGFELIKNKKQLVSYAGLDIREKLSGTSVKGKASISKKGNRNLRKALYFPAMTAIRHNEQHEKLYVRLVEKTGIKMKGQVAVQRKLLELIYVIYKSKKAFKKNYEKEKGQQQENAVAP